MRAVRRLFCAAALVACLAPGVRADEYTKQAFLTFSGPVQLPGITLPAGTYQIKLADPESGRRALQVWDKDGNKLFITLLTVPDERMKPSDEPVVVFGERAAGQAQPIRAWFYPNETYGQEFVYPKDQAMKIARATHSSVLAFEGDTTDAAAFKAAKIGRMDENGRMTESDAAGASNDTATHDAQSASTTTASGASTTIADSDTAAQSSNAQSDASLNTPARRASTQSQSEPRASAPSANATDGSAPVGTSGSATTAPAATSTTSEANRDNIPSAAGTTGATNNAPSANQTGQAAAGANAAAPRSNGSQPPPASPTGTAGTAARTLPSTAGSMTLVQLLAALSLAGAFAVRIFRVRASQSR
jgi:hypothetical protein